MFKIMILLSFLSVGPSPWAQPKGSLAERALIFARGSHPGLALSPKRAQAFVDSITAHAQPEHALRAYREAHAYYQNFHRITSTSSAEGRSFAATLIHHTQRPAQWWELYREIYEYAQEHFFWSEEQNLTFLALIFSKLVKREGPRAAWESFQQYQAFFYNHSTLPDVQRELKTVISSDYAFSLFYLPTSEGRGRLQQMQRLFSWVREQANADLAYRLAKQLRTREAQLGRELVQGVLDCFDRQKELGLSPEEALRLAIDRSGLQWPLKD